VTLPLRRVGLATGALVALALPEAGRTQGVLDPTVGVHLEQAGFAFPTGIAFLGPDEYLVIEKNSGKVRYVTEGAIAGDALDVPVDPLSERGLLGIVVNTEQPPRVFLYYSEASADGAPAFANRVYRYTWNSVTHQLESPQLILDLPITFGPNHNGGTLLLGPPGEAPGVGDGALLYVVIGDLNRDGQLQNYPGGPLPDETGVIFRVRQDGSPAPGNPLSPFCSNAPEVACASDATCGGGSCQLQVSRYFAYGVRNSFGLALDPVTGALWDTENGPALYDEINRVPAGANSGWERIMGPVVRDPEGTSDLFAIPGSSYHDPEFSFVDTIGITSIVFPVGSSLPAAYDDRVLVGDINNGHLYALPLDGSRMGFDLTGFPGLADAVAEDATEAAPLVVGFAFGGITDLEVGPDGDVYVVSFSGSVYRLGPAPVPLLETVPRAVLAALALLVATRRRRRRALG
jgi:glucose/arabinose dehydrogenase